VKTGRRKNTDVNSIVKLEKEESSHGHAGKTNAHKRRKVVKK
jgi:hypothetical protein